jgi:hypothetical protein
MHAALPFGEDVRAGSLETYIVRTPRSRSYPNGGRSNQPCERTTPSKEKSGGSEIRMRAKVGEAGIRFQVLGVRDAS